MKNRKSNQEKNRKLLNPLQPNEMNDETICAAQYSKFPRLGANQYLHKCTLNIRRIIHHYFFPQVAAVFDEFQVHRVSLIN